MDIADWDGILALYMPFELDFEGSPDGLPDDTIDINSAIISWRWLNVMIAPIATTSRMIIRSSNLRRRLLLFKRRACFESMGFGSDG